MSDIVVPIDVEAAAAAAAGQAIAQYRAEPGLVQLLNVQRPLPRHVARFFPRAELDAWYRDAGMRVLGPAARLLDEAGVPHRDHVLVGKPAEAIVQFASEHRSERVLLDNGPGGAFAMLGLGSLGSQVRHLMATLPSKTPA